MWLTLLICETVKHFTSEEFVFMVFLQFTDNQKITKTSKQKNYKKPLILRYITFSRIHDCIMENSGQATSDTWNTSYIK